MNAVLKPHDDREIVRENGQEYLTHKGYAKIVREDFMYLECLVNGNFQKIFRSVDGVTTMPMEKLWTLYQMAWQCINVRGLFMECGVFAGGSASLIAQTIAGSGKKLHLFDTFAGMPETDERFDIHVAGDFAIDDHGQTVTLDSVKAFVGHQNDVVFHQGFIPNTFTDMPREPISFAHVDVDIYQAMKDCCEWIYPRLSAGGVIIFDDYAQPTCPGARKAIDEYFFDKRSIPLPIGYQAMVFKV
jgi:O-methyltransferase